MVHMTSDARYSTRTTLLRAGNGTNTGESTLRMRQIGPVVVETLPSQSSAPPGVPPACRTVIGERSRLEWRLRDGGDPARSCRGLPRRQRTAASATSPTATGQRHHGATGVCGAAVFVSAAAGAAMVGGAARAAHARRRPCRTSSRWSTTTARAPAGAARGGPAAPGGSGRGGRAGAPARARRRRARRSARRSPAATSTRSTWSGHASAAYTGDPLPALRRLGRLPGARYGGVLTGRRLGDRLRVAGDPGARSTGGRVRHPTDQGHPAGDRRRAGRSCSPRRRSGPST